jgi:hypothetical protein
MDPFRHLLVQQMSQRRLKEAEEWRQAKLATGSPATRPPARMPRPRVAAVLKPCRVQVFQFCLLT